MNNAERFLEIYNEVDRFLTDFSSGKYESYSDKIRNSTKPIIKRYHDQLLDYGDLRNAIVHRPKKDDNYIANPLDKVVKDFEYILEKLKNPPRVFSKFCFKVEGVKQNEKLDSALKIMCAKSFSQMPIFDDEGEKVVEILNTNTISRWLGRNIKNNEIVEENPTISELFQDIEFRKNYKFISKECDTYTAYHYFTEQIKKHSRNLDVLLITNNGKENEPLLGLITVADIAKLSP